MRVSSTRAGTRFSADPPHAESVQESDPSSIPIASVPPLHPHCPCPGAGTSRCPLWMAIAACMVSLPSSQLTSIVLKDRSALLPPSRSRPGSPLLSTRSMPRSLESWPSLPLLWPIPSSYPCAGRAQPWAAFPMGCSLRSSLEVRPPLTCWAGTDKWLLQNSSYTSFPPFLSSSDLHSLN